MGVQRGKGKLQRSLEDQETTTKNKSKAQELTGVTLPEKGITLFITNLI